MSSNDWSEYNRQPFMAVWQILFKTIFQLLKSLWPLILVIFVRSDGDSNRIESIFLILFPFIAFASAFTNYVFFKFRITEEHIQVKSGIFSREQITLPLHKIQAVHSNQNWIQKILNISELAFDTPGSEKAELKLQLTTHQAKELMSYVLNKTEEKEQSQNEEQFVSGLSFEDLIKIGLTSNHFKTLLILIGVFLSFLNNIKDLLDNYQNDLLEVSAHRVLESSILFIAMGIIVILFLSIVVSLIRTILTYINFRITKTVKGFNITKGLINNSQRLVPFEKIQYVSWRTNWLRKKIPIYLFEFHTMGGKEMSNNLRIKVPAASEMVLHKLSATYFTNIPDQFSSNLKVHPSYFIRNSVFFGIIPWLIVCISLFFFADEKLLLMFLWPLYAILHFGLYSRKFLFSWTSEIINIKSGVFGNRTLVLKWKMIQSVKVSQSLFQRKCFLADLTIHTAGGTITAPYIPLAAARELQDFALFKIES